MTEQTEPKLKPCPFCGSTAEWRRSRLHGECSLYWAECSNYECSVELALGEFTMQDAADKWNRRTPTEPDGPVLVTIKRGDQSVKFDLDRLGPVDSRREGEGAA